MKTLYSMLAGLFTLSLLTACGGGGGASGLTGNTGLGTTVTSGVSITGEMDPNGTNGPNVAAAVLNGVTAVIGGSAIAASATPLITGVAVNTPAGHFSLPGLVLDQLARVSDVQITTAGTGVVGVALGQNLPCTNGGFAVLNAGTDVQDPNFNELNIGDVLNVSLFLCDETGVILDGNLVLTVSAIAGGGPFDGTAPYTITLDVVFNALRALDGSEYYYADGDMRLVLDEDMAGNMNQVLSGMSLDTSYNDHDQRLEFYNFVADDLTTGDFTLDLDGTLDSRDIDGKVDFTTTNSALDPTVATFTGNVANPNGDPDAGVLLVSSVLDTSQLRLTAQNDALNVSIEVKPDGAALFDPPLPLWLWTALRAL